MVRAPGDAEEVSPTAEPDEARRDTEELDGAARPAGRGRRRDPALRRRLQESPGRVQALEERLLETKGQLAQAVSQNEKLTFTLQQAKEQLAALREEVEKLTQPPAAYGTFLGVNEDGTVDVFSGGRKMRVALHPDIDPGVLRKGQRGGPQRVAQRRAGPRRRALGRGGHPQRGPGGRPPRHRLRPGRRGAGGRALRGAARRQACGRATPCSWTRGPSCSSRSCPGPRVEELVLEEVPDITYADVGGLDTQIEAITDAVELPYLHRELFAEYQLPAPKGILLYGPPGAARR